MLKTLDRNSAGTHCTLCDPGIGRAAKRCIGCEAISERQHPQGRNLPRQTAGVASRAPLRGSFLFRKKGLFQLEAEDGFALVTIEVYELREPERASALVSDILWLLKAWEVRVLIMDFGNVTVHSSVFIGQLIQLRNALDVRNIQIRLCGLAPEARKAFQICRLDKLIPVYGSLEDALKP